MRVLCSYCRQSMGEKAPFESDLITHGICPTCDEYFERQWSGLDLSGYLDGLGAPVLVVDADGRIMGLGQEMSRMLGRAAEDCRRLLGGEVFECVYARLPEGCGQTVHCAACTIRRTVMHTMSTGEALSGVAAHVDRDGETLRVRLTTERIPEGVRVIVSDPERVPFRRS